jgi:hypothetical protein
MRVCPFNQGGLGGIWLFAPIKQSDCIRYAYEREERTTDGTGEGCPRGSNTRLSLDGLGGTGIGIGVGGGESETTRAPSFIGLKFELYSAAASSEKNDSNLRRSLSFSSPDGAGSPISTRASRLDNLSGFSRSRAFCIASRAVGDGGRGAGFMACATISGIVGMLHDDITGSNTKVNNE